MEHDIKRPYCLHIATTHNHVAPSPFYEESAQILLRCIVCLHLDRLERPFTSLPKCGRGSACRPGCAENADVAIDFPLLLKSRSSPFTTTSLKGGRAYQTFAYHYVNMFSVFTALLFPEILLA